MPAQEYVDASGENGQAEKKVPDAKPLSSVLMSRYWDLALREDGAQRNCTVAESSAAQVIFAAASGAGPPQGTKVPVSDVTQPWGVRAFTRQKCAAPGCRLLHVMEALLPPSGP